LSVEQPCRFDLLAATPNGCIGTPGNVRDGWRDALSH